MAQGIDAERLTRRSYDGRAENYDAKRFSSETAKFWHAHDIRVVNELLGDPGRPVRVLEVAFGTGRMSVCLSSPGRTIYGIELSSDMTAKAADKTRGDSNLNCYWMRANAAQLPFADECFDGVYSVRFLNLFTVPELKTICAEIQRVVKKDGVMVLHFSNVFYGGIISIVRRALGHYSKHLLWPYQVKRLFPGCEIQANRGTYLPFQRWLLSLLGARKAERAAEWISKAPLKIFTHTMYYRVVKR